MAVRVVFVAVLGDFAVVAVVLFVCFGLFSLSSPDQPFSGQRP